MIDMKVVNSDPPVSDLDSENQGIIERQAVKFAKEFSSLYKSEKVKRVALEALSQELKERNDDLMDIVFLTSNQFLEPIKNIDSNLNVIRESTQHQDVKFVENLNEIENSVETLRQLVKEMSKLYRVNSTRSLFRPVSLDRILDEIIRDLTITAGLKNDVVQVESLPILETDDVQLRILFHQLVDLGTRCQSKDEPSSLSIKAENNARGLWRISLKAKGPSYLRKEFGFGRGGEQKYMDRSLDLCQRISQRLGGFIYGEMVSEDVFSCHVVLPGKNIPLDSHLKDQINDY